MPGQCPLFEVKKPRIGSMHGDMSHGFFLLSLQGNSGIKLDRMQKKTTVHVRVSLFIIYGVSRNIKCLKEKYNGLVSADS